MGDSIIDNLKVKPVGIGTSSNSTNRSFNANTNGNPNPNPTDNANPNPSSNATAGRRTGPQQQQQQQQQQQRSTQEPPTASSTAPNNPIRNPTSNGASRQQHQHSAQHGRRQQGKKGKGGDHELRAFLRRPGCLKFLDTFKDNGITTVSKALQLDYSDLEELGIPRSFRGKILKEITFRNSRARNQRQHQQRGNQHHGAEENVGQHNHNPGHNPNPNNSTAGSHANSNASGNGYKPGGNGNSNTGFDRRGKKKSPSMQVRQDFDAFVLGYVQSREDATVDTLKAQLSQLDPRLQDTVSESGGLKQYLHNFCESVKLDPSSGKLSVNPHPKQRRGNARKGKDSKDKDSQDKDKDKSVIEAEKRILKELRQAKDKSYKVSALRAKLNWNAVQPKLGQFTQFLNGMDSVKVEKGDKGHGWDFVCRLLPGGDTKPQPKKPKKVRQFSADHFLRSLVRKLKTANGTMPVSELRKKIRNHSEWQQNASKTGTNLEAFLAAHNSTFAVNNGLVRLLPKANAHEKDRDRGKGEAKSGGGRGKLEHQILVRNVPVAVEKDAILRYFAQFGSVKDFRWNNRDRDQAVNAPQQARSCIIEFHSVDVVNAIRQQYDHRIANHPVEVKTLATGLTSTSRSQPSSPRGQSGTTGASIAAPREQVPVQVQIPMQVPMKPGVILCAQGIGQHISDKDIFQALNAYGIYGITRVKSKALAFLYMKENDLGKKAIQKVRAIAETPITMGLAARQDGTPNVLNTYQDMPTAQAPPAPVLTQPNPVAAPKSDEPPVNLDLREEDGRLHMNLSPNSAYIWMKEEKMPPELDLNMNDPKGDSIVSSAQASISRAMETRNEISELIRSVQLDRLVPVPAAAESSSSNAGYIPPPQMHQQWLDPLGFNNAFAHQMHAVPPAESHAVSVSVPATEAKPGSETTGASAVADTTGSVDDVSHSHEQQKRRLETFGSNMGALGLMQQHVRSEEAALEVNVQPPMAAPAATATNEPAQPPAGLDRFSAKEGSLQPLRGSNASRSSVSAAMKEKAAMESRQMDQPRGGLDGKRQPVPVPVAEKKSRMIRTDLKPNPFELDTSANPPPKMNANLTKPRAGVRDSQGQRLNQSKTSPKSRMIKTKDQFSAAFELKTVPPEAAKPTKPKIKNESSLDAFELQTAPSTVKSTVTGAGLSRFDKPSSERKDSATQNAPQAQKPMSTLGKPGLGGLDAGDKDKKSSWAALTKKQTGVGPRLVSLKSSAPKASTQSTSWGDSKSKGLTPLAGSGLSSLSKKFASSTSFTTLRPQKSVSALDRPATTAAAPAAAQPAKKMSSLARLAAKHEIKNQEFPTLSSVQLADEAERGRRSGESKAPNRLRH